MNHVRHCKNVAAVTACCAFAAAPALANDAPPVVIPPGEMCWHIPGGFIDFGAGDIPPIPADFFGPGSEPFEGRVELHGFAGPTGGCDLRIGRLEPLPLPIAPLPTATTIPIEILQLDLVSVEPITASNGTQWTCEITIPPVALFPGVLDVTRDHTHGGVFSGEIPILPLLTFINIDEPTDQRQILLNKADLVPPLPLPWTACDPMGRVPMPPNIFLAPCLPQCIPDPGHALVAAGDAFGIDIQQHPGAFQPTCLAPDNGQGTVDLPAQCPFINIPGEPLLIDQGLPPETTIHMSATVDSFFDIAYQVGGSFGPDGQIVTCQAQMMLDVQGTGELADLTRALFLPIAMEFHIPPPSLDPLQSFPTELVMLQGELFGDPDFCTLRIQGGEGFGLPGAGHTTLTRLEPGGEFIVDSFFDITYEIEWQGCPGSVIEGMGGMQHTEAPLVQGGIPRTPVDAHGFTHIPLGGACLGEDADCRLMVSNIGSSGDDGVYIETGPTRGMCAELLLPPMGAFPHASRNAHEGFFDIAPRGQFSKVFWALEGNPDGTARVLFDPGSLPFEPGPIELLILDEAGIPAWNAPLPNLVVGNIGSSGQDGVTMGISSIEDGCCPALPGVPLPCTGLVFHMALPMPTDFVLDGVAVSGSHLWIVAPTADELSLPPLHAACISASGLLQLPIVGERVYAMCHQHQQLGDDTLIRGTPEGGLRVEDIGLLGDDGVRTTIRQPGGDFQVDSFFDVFYDVVVVEPDGGLNGALHFAGIEHEDIGRADLQQIGLSIVDTGDNLEVRNLFGAGHGPMAAIVEARLNGAVVASYEGDVLGTWAAVLGDDIWPSAIQAQRITVPGGPDEIQVVLRPPSAARDERGNAGAPTISVMIAGASAPVDADELMIHAQRPHETAVRNTRGSGSRASRRGAQSRGEEVAPTSSGFTAFDVRAQDIDSFTIIDQISIAPPCPGDANGDHLVNVADLLVVINNWGGNGLAGGDITQDGVVNVADLLAVINNWGNSC